MEQSPINVGQQRQLLQTTLARAIAILTETASLNVEKDPVFGKGKYRAPKSQKEPDIYFFSEPVVPEVGFEFRRPNENSPWNELRARIKWTQLYQSGESFTAQFFADLGLVFDRSYREPDANAPDDPNRGDHHFIFKIKDVPNGQAEFVSEQHLSDLKDQYPKMFHYCVITVGR
jgi:hypothetical protein